MLQSCLLDFKIKILAEMTEKIKFTKSIADVMYSVLSDQEQSLNEGNEYKIK